MGVSISAYSNVKFFQSIEDTSPNQEERFWRVKNLTTLYRNEYFEEWQDDLENGWYFFDEEFDIMNRSYGGYGVWRNDLCQLIHKIEAKEFWEKARNEDISNYPFYWLIHFSDCEGFLGPKKCEILLQDFNDHKAQLKLGLPNNIWGQSTFVDEWITALEAVAGNGVVDFS